jgi:hypothetical protein
MFILKRNDNPHLASSVTNTDFECIRNMWNDSHDKHKIDNFGKWLSRNNIQFEFIDNSETGLYRVTKIMFNSENEFLVFKLKHI